MKMFVRRVIPLILGKNRYFAAREAYRNYLHYRAILSDYGSVRKQRLIDDRWFQSILRIRQLKNKHEGKRCFIIGNGPSLKKTDLSLLKNEITFGMNRIYMLFDKLNFCTTYYVSINKLVVKQFAHDIERLPCTKFINLRAADFINFTDDMMFIRPGDRLQFCTDLAEGYGKGGTVTYAAIQIAYYMGFDTIILIGVDHSFTTKGTPNSEVVSKGDDPNHFDPQYFGKGVRWQLPDLEKSELAYQTAKNHFEQAGRKIVDATIDGNLQVFPKTDYYNIFK
jgi:hypothetical protein